jgi:hypothetical protein
VIPDTVLCRVVGLQFGLQTLHGPMSAYTAKADQFDARLSVSFIWQVLLQKRIANTVLEQSPSWNIGKRGS